MSKTPEKVFLFKGLFKIPEGNPLLLVLSIVYYLLSDFATTNSFSPLQRK
jgi:hypothetical protein